MNKAERPPITVEYLEQQGPPFVSSPAYGIVMVVSGDGYESVDMTPDQADKVAKELVDWAYTVREREAENEEDR